MRPELILQQTLPGRIGRPGSVVLRQLGETSETSDELILHNTDPSIPVR